MAMKNSLILFALSLAAGLTLISCSELKNDIPGAAPALTTHPAGWADDPTSPDFHGRALKVTVPAWNAATCARCHGSDWAGGTSGKTCYKCHAAYPHDKKFTVSSTDSTGHIGYLQGNAYPLSQCQSCHGASYTGGAIANVTCEKSGCHVDASGTGKSPEACNTCHGTFNGLAADPVSWAPPKSVLGSTDSTLHNVGAHMRHLKTGRGRLLKCAECHSVPATVFSAGHFDSAPPAEVMLNDTLANYTPTLGQKVNSTHPAYDPAVYKCSNVYCHGNFVVKKGTSGVRGQDVWTFAFTDSVMVGRNVSPDWTAGKAFSSCSACHGDPTVPGKISPQGHRDYTADGLSCSNCHTKFGTDPSTHINGKANVFGQEYPL